LGAESQLSPISAAQVGTTGITGGATGGVTGGGVHIDGLVIAPVYGHDPSHAVTPVAGVPHALEVIQSAPLLGEHADAQSDSLGALAVHEPSQAITPDDVRPQELLAEHERPTFDTQDGVVGQSDSLGATALHEPSH
jgi:hypothetical protein